MRMLVAAVALLVLVTGCGGNDRPSASGTAPSPVISRTPPARVVAGGPAVLQLRVVLRSSADGSTGSHVTVPAGWLSRYAAYRCGTGAEGDPTGYALACDSSGVRYLLAPTAWSGRADHAEAVPPHDGMPWALDVALDSTGADALARLSRQLVAHGGRAAIVVDGAVLTAPGFAGVITDGAVEITGDLTGTRARALAARLTGR